MKMWKYLQIDRIVHLPCDGRELLGKLIYFTEKRDGSCLAVWFKEESGKKAFLKKLFKIKLCKYLTISSHHQQKAEGSIAKAFWHCEDRPQVLEFLRDNQNHIVFGELLRTGLSPTRIEKHEKVEYIIFDIFDGTNLLNYQQVHQICYHYNMKCVRLFGEGRFVTMESLFNYRDEMLELCKKEGREGVVLKTFGEDGKPIYAKEKLDTATPRGLPKIEHGKPEYPFLPLSEAQGAVDKAYADLGEAFKNKAIAMPKINTYIKEEMKKHMCGPPEANYYRLYLDYLEAHGLKTESKVVVTQAKVTKTGKFEVLRKILNKLRRRKK